MKLALCASALLLAACPEKAAPPAGPTWAPASGGGCDVAISGTWGSR